eukprot:14103134-Alexandrium_andersonii.AAC.1
MVLADLLPAALRPPRRVSDAESYERCLACCPPAPRCEDCIAGKGVGQAHRQVNVHDPDFVAE